MAIQNEACTVSYKKIFYGNFEPLEPVYTKRQRQRCDESAMTLQNGFATHFQVSPLISMRTESVVSSQSGRSVDADA